MPSATAATHQQDPLPTLLSETVPCTSKSVGLNCDAKQASKLEKQAVQFQSQKSLAADTAKQQKMCQAQWAEKVVHPQAFHLKNESLERWSAASKIKAHLSCWLKSKNQTAIQPLQSLQSSPTKSTEKVWAPWQEEPEPPSTLQLETLLQLKSILLEQHEDMAAAFQFIAKNSGRDASFTKRDLRTAMSHMQSSSRTSEAQFPDAGHTFCALLALYRHNGPEIAISEFMRFPQLLEREQSFRKQLMSPILVDDDQLLVGKRLDQQLKSGVDTPAEAHELLQNLSAALEFEPKRTSNVLIQNGHGSGVKAGLDYIARFTDDFGAPKPGVRLEILIAGWEFCSAFTKQAVALGAAPHTKAHPNQIPELAESLTAMKPMKPMKSADAVFATLVRVKKVVSSKKKKETKDVMVLSPYPVANEVKEKSHEEKCRDALWEALPPGKMLWTLAHGAEDLNDEDYERLLQAAWAMFDSFDAVSWMLGPVGLARLRPKLDELSALRLRASAMSSDLDDAHSVLVRSNALLQNIQSVCAADPRLARTAALFGASFLAERARCVANSSINLVTDEAASAQGRATASATAQLNRTATALAAALMPHVEELLGGRKVQLRKCGSAVFLEIARPSEKVINPLADVHKIVSSEVNANAVALLEVDEAEYRWGKILSDSAVVSGSKGDDSNWGKAVSDGAAAGTRHRRHSR